MITGCRHVRYSPLVMPISLSMAYTVSVIASRFGLAPLASRFDTRLVIAAAVSVMALAVAGFLTVGESVLLYAAVSVFVGLGYGLALPNVQAQAVNVSGEEIRPRVLPLAGLLFQAAILLFPLAAGVRAPRRPPSQGGLEGRGAVSHTSARR